MSLYNQAEKEEGKFCYAALHFYLILVGDSGYEPRTSASEVWCASSDTNKPKQKALLRKLWF